jgi:ankyrin repeat protein
MHESHSLIIAHLLTFPIQINAKERQGLTPLHVCTDTPAARLLVKSGADVRARDEGGKVAIHYASHENTIMLIEEGSEVDPRDDRGRTPLHVVTEGDKVEYLLGKGADVNARDDEGKTPLDWAREVERWDVAQVIEKRGGMTGATLDENRRRCVIQ